MEYEFLQSGQRQIRLLSFDPQAPSRKGASSDLVHCTLETVSLDDLRNEYRNFTDQLDPERVFHRNTQAHWCEVTSENATSSMKVDLAPLRSAYRFEWGDYATLSYCWGDPASSKPILVNGQIVYVTKNLEEALQALHKTGVFQGRYKLWNDAVCINQKDLEEKSHQIRMMGEIYRRSWNVVVWLGPQEGYSNEGLGFMGALAKHWPNHEEIQKRLQSDSRFSGIGGAHGLEELGQRPYWSRVWIIQELTNGHNQTPIICGSKMIEWEKIWKGLDVFMSMDDPAAFVNADRKSIGINQTSHAFGRLVGIIRLSELMERCRQTTDQNFVPVLMNYSRSSKSTDDRDRIYGMLHLMENRISSLVVPDYTKSVPQVFASFLGTYIAAYDHIDLIRQAGLSSSTMQPTWAPDWAVNIAPRTEIAISKPFKSFPNSLGNLARATTHGEKLICSSIIFDKVDGILHMQQRYQTRFLNSSTNRHGYESDEQALDAFRRNLLGDRNHKDELPTPEELLVRPLGELSTQRAFERKWVSIFDESSDWNMCGQTFAEYFAAAYPDIPDSRKNAPDASNPALERMVSVIHGRVLITTRRGYFGLASQREVVEVPGESDVREGDIICVIFGCTMPLITRPYRDGYQLVGECYVQGMMNGEVEQFVVSQEAKVEEMILY